MSSDSPVEIQNIDRLLKKLKDLGADMKVAAGEAGMAALLPVEKAAKEKVTKNTDTGITRVNITTKIVNQEGTLVVRCGTNQKSAVYLEFGTGKYAENGQGRKKPWIWPVKSRKWQKIFFGRAMKSTQQGPARPSPLWFGSHPHPFMRPAWDENKDKVLATFKEGLQAAVSKYT